MDKIVIDRWMVDGWIDGIREWMDGEWMNRTKWLAIEIHNRLIGTCVEPHV
jgi:hypothetical protein